jgi:hypothetical protein
MEAIKTENIPFLHENCHLYRFSNNGMWVLCNIITQLDAEIWVCLKGGVQMMWRNRFSLQQRFLPSYFGAMPINCQHTSIINPILPSKNGTGAQSVFINQAVKICGSCNRDRVGRQHKTTTIWQLIKKPYHRCSYPWD